MNPLKRDENINELGRLLASRVRMYKKKHPRMSYQQIAKRFDMSASTLNRIINEDIKKPSITQVFKILKGTESEDILNLLDHFYPDVAMIYRDIYRSMENEIQTVKNKDEEYLSDEKYFRIILISYSRVGTTKDEIKKIFGEEGNELLKKLVNEKIVSIDSEGKIKGCRDLLSLSLRTMRDVFSKSLTQCSDLSFNKGYNFLSYHSESISKEGQKRIQEILYRANDEIKEVLTDSQYQGELQVYTGMASDLLS